MFSLLYFLIISSINSVRLNISSFSKYEELVNLMTCHNVALFDGVKLPGKIEFIPLEDEGHKTIIKYDVWHFNKAIPSSYFTTQYVSRLK